MCRTGRISRGGPGHAVWHDRQGPADEVLQEGELPDPQPGPEEVRARVRFSGVNPGDPEKRRAGWSLSGAGLSSSAPCGVPPTWTACAAPRRLASSPDRVSDNIDLDAAVTGNGAVIAAYATRRDRPDFPFWPLLFDNVTVRLFGSDDSPAAAKQRAVEDLTAAAVAGALSIPLGAALPLGQAAEAHARVDAGSRGRILLAVPD